MRFFNKIKHEHFQLISTNNIYSLVVNKCIFFKGSLIDFNYYQYARMYSSAIDHQVNHNAYMYKIMV
jgi:hypothetical protein